MINRNELTSYITKRFGLGVNISNKISAEGQVLIIQPINIARTIGFQIEITIGWRSLETKFIPGPYASSLVEAMQNSTSEQREIFKVFVNSAIAKGAKINLKINETNIGPLAINEWPDKWEYVELEFRKGSLVLNTSNDKKEKETLFPWVARFFGIILSLLPLESTEEPDIYTFGEEEGEKKATLVKYYERSHINRAACIEIHGFNCHICGINFAEQYGIIGYGFIHVHHIKPLSLMEGSYIINPAEDLIPVCPNCHAMLHQKTPPLTIEDLQNIISKK